MSLIPNVFRRILLAGSAAFASLLCLDSVAGSPAPEKTVLVTIVNGTLRGSDKNGAMIFKGVPYADSTSGENRFRAPQPVQDWEGERSATELGPLCPQEKSSMGKNEAIFEWYYQDEPMAENCLVLNIYTPDVKSNAKRPVMFYVHGGGYINGGGGGSGLDGSNLARFGDVVVVTINHRLNAFGYTAFTEDGFEDAANAGHLDIIAALEWVKHNITAFGGDPDNVTLFGQSGGGSKILSLLAMPGAQGLFHKAISMSGAAGLDIDAVDDMAPYVRALKDELGVQEPAALQDLPWNEILDARKRAVASSGLDGARPVIDGRHIDTLPMSAEGLRRHADIPLLLGFTRTESTLFFRSDMRNFSITEDQMRTRMKKVFGIGDAHINAIMEGYRSDNPSMTPSDILIAVASDVQFRIPLENAAITMASAERHAPVWMYNFSWTIPQNGGVLGSPHAVDIPFAFGTLDEAGAMIGAGDSALETSLNMMQAFVNFARHGDPNSERLPHWDPYTAENRAQMIIDASPRVVFDWRGAVRDELSTLKIDPFDRASLYRYQD